jgi:hypothetical protein
MTTTDRLALHRAASDAMDAAARARNTITARACMAMYRYCCRAITEATKGEPQA